MGGVSQEAKEPMELILSAAERVRVRLKSHKITRRNKLHNRNKDPRAMKGGQGCETYNIVEIPKEQRAGSVKKDPPGPSLEHKQQALSGCKSQSTPTGFQHIDSEWVLTTTILANTCLTQRKNFLCAAASTFVPDFTESVDCFLNSPSYLLACSRNTLPSVGGWAPMPLQHGL